MNIVTRLLSRIRRRSNPVGASISQPWERTLGVGSDWAPDSYGDYMATSAPVFAAIQLRASAVSRPPARVIRQVMVDGDAQREWVGPDHPAQVLMDKVNPHWTRGDLWRATETYMGLWGVAYWAIVYADGTPVEVWPLRSDRVRVLPDPEKYIKGYVYSGKGGKLTGFAPDEILRIRYFNPKDEYAGLSPLAPARLSVDLGRDALRGNRYALANDASPGLVLESEETPSDEEVKAFYDRWESRFQGMTKRGRPALLGAGLKAVQAGFSPKDLQHLESMRWSLGDVARVYNVPLPMLHELSRATYSNMATARRTFWEDCIVPQLIFYGEGIQEYLLPKFGDPSLTIEFDTTQIEALQEDEGAKATRRKTYVDSGIMTVNEIRGDMGLAPSEQPEADELKLTGAGGGGLFGGFGESSVVKPVFRLPREMRRLGAEERGREIEKAFRAALDPREKRFAAVLSELFRRQMQDVMRELEASRVAVPAGIRGNGHDRGLPAPEVLFDASVWEPVFVEMGRPMIEEALRNSADQMISKFGLGISFDVKHPLPQRWIESRTRWWASRINETTGKQITGAVSQANIDGWSLDQLADRIKDIDGINQGARSQVIARTEMVGAQNEGHLQAFEQAEVPAKQWLAAQDERTRVAHAEAHLQTRRVNADFDVGGEMLRAPGQGGSAGNVINCRCVTIPVFDIKEE